MANMDSKRDINQRLEHRGVRFGIKRTSRPYAAPEYQWMIYLPSSPREGVQSGHTDGLRAFLRAYKEAQAAIDRWLDRRPTEN